VESLTRPYRVSIPMILLVSLIPGYLYLASLMPERTLHTPALAVDRLLPLRPSWALVYGVLYLFLIVLPVFVVRHPEHLRRTVGRISWCGSPHSLGSWPIPPWRHARPPCWDGFAVWGLRFLYAADPPYNCFPSLHVAHSFVSALTSFRAHRSIGAVATVGASLVAVSTLYTKQHYVVDVGAGILLAAVAYGVLLRPFRRDPIPLLDRRLVPLFALLTMGLVAVVLACFWVAYRISAIPR